MNSLVVFCWIGLKLRSRSFVQNIAEPRLTSARECAIVDAMSRARLMRLPLGGSPVAPSLALGRQALEPVDKSAGGGRSHQCRGSSGRSVSPDGNSFEIIPGDMTGLPDADRLQFLREAEEGRYSRLFAFQREQNGKSLIDDLGVLEDCSSGVYVLMQTKPAYGNKCQVFVGMTGDYGEMVKYYERQADTNQKIEHTNRLLTLAECLKEQHENPPKNMPEWDLAIVIPEYENTALLYSMLFNIFTKAEGFIARKTLSNHVSYDLFRMHNDHHFFILGLESINKMHYLSAFLADPTFYFGLFSCIVSLSTLIQRIRAKRNRPNGGKAEKLEEKYTNQDKSVDVTIKSKGDNNNIDNFIGDVYIDRHTNIYNIFLTSEEFLNKNFPRESNPFPRRVINPHGDFGE